MAGRALATVMQFDSSCVDKGVCLRLSPFQLTPGVCGGGGYGPDRPGLLSISTAKSGAVVKVPPPVGYVKYKAQHVVLPTQIPLFLACYKLSAPEMPGNSCGIPIKWLWKRGFERRAAAQSGRPTQASPVKPTESDPASASSALIETSLPTPAPQGAEAVHLLWKQVGKWKKGNQPQ